MNMETCSITRHGAATRSTRCESPNGCARVTLDALGLLDRLNHIGRLVEAIQIIGSSEMDGEGKALDAVTIALNDRIDDMRLELDMIVSEGGAA